MYFQLLSHATFWSFLLALDKDLAEQCKQQRCPCGGRLHCAHFPRKPRGVASALLSDEDRRRFSFCCSVCRKRVTPPSVRFLGRKVYLGAVVVLVGAMRQGASPRRVRELTELFGADRKTINRWRTFWEEQFPPSPFWNSARALLAPVFKIVDFPRSLLEAFVHHGEHQEGWKNLLLFLSPITTREGLGSSVFDGFQAPAEDGRRPV